MTRILIVTASKHGSTKGIGEELAKELDRHHVEVVQAEAEGAPSPVGFDAVILGSAVYMGRWIDALKRYVHDHQDALREVPVFLFSSGPLSAGPPKATDTPADAAPMVEATRAREHVVFAGRLDRDQLSFFERTVAKLIQAPFHDFRPWNEIDAWADHIASEIARPEARAAG